MKRDMDLVRKILFEIEAHPPTYGPLNINIDGYSKEQIDYNLTLMADAGLIIGINAGSESGYGNYSTITIPMRMTWEGHEFLDASRDEGVWVKAKEKLKSLGGEVPLEVVKTVLIEIMKKQLGM